MKNFILLLFTVAASLYLYDKFLVSPNVNCEIINLPMMNNDTSVYNIIAKNNGVNSSSFKNIGCSYTFSGQIVNSTFFSFWSDCVIYEIIDNSVSIYLPMSGYSCQASLYLLVKE